MVRSKKWLIRSGILSLVAGSTLVVGVACAGATDVSGLEEDVAGLSAQVTALQNTVSQAVEALGGATGGDDAGTGGAVTPTGGNRTLEQIRAEGRLVCGVQSATPGFGTAARVGHDVDYCRAIAAAIFGTVNEGAGGNLEFDNASGTDRFPKLAAGTIDVLVRTTTWTSGRDSNLGAQFTATTFFDRFGMMVPPALAREIRTAEDLDGLRACARAGTSTLDGLQDLASQAGISFNPSSSEDDSAAVLQYQAGQCDILASDTSQLAGQRTTFTGELANSVILSGAQLTTRDGRQIQTAKEPLGPSVHTSAGAELFDLVQWVNFGLITAEEQGITQSNVRTRAAAGTTGNTPVAQRVLGIIDNGFTFNGKVVGGQQWLQNVIAAVGNFGEIYDANLGDGGLGLDRACTAQALWFQSEDTARGSAVWQDCDGDGTITLEENRGLIYAPRFSG